MKRATADCLLRLPDFFEKKDILAPEGRRKFICFGKFVKKFQESISIIVISIK